MTSTVSPTVELTLEHLESLSLELKHQELKDHKMFCIHFILTFDDKFELGDKSKQQMFMSLVPECTSDKDFLTYLFDTMSHDEVKHLIKISTCMMYIRDESDIPQFLNKRGGKYFFNVKVNKDDDTKKNKSFRDIYLKKKQ